MDNLPKPRFTVAGCPVDAISFTEVLATLGRRIEQRIPTHVVFVNAAKVVGFHDDPELSAAMRGADLLLADGVPVVWASRLLGQTLPGRVAGIDLAEEMVALAAQRGYRVFFLGARAEVLAKAVAGLGRRHPQLKVAGARDGYFQPADEAALIEEINESMADLLLLGMGTPQKELWAARNLAFLAVPVLLGVGGSFDVMAGVTRRAPTWMQKTGLEWFYRLCQEPRRMWRRYLYSNPRFVWLVLQDAWRRASGEKPAARPG